MKKIPMMIMITAGMVLVGCNNTSDPLPSVAPPQNQFSQPENTPTTTTFTVTPQLPTQITTTPTVTPQTAASNTGQVVFETVNWRVTNQNNNMIAVDRLNHGKKVRTSYLPISKPLDVYKVYGSFQQNGSGWFLVTSSPGLGLMGKTLYETDNDGESWSLISDLSSTIQSCYPTGITFRNASDGWLSATYHGGDLVPLYHTTDGGKTWLLQKIDVPTGYKYGDTYAPVFDSNDPSKGTLQIHFVADEKRIIATYITTDGGKMWTKQSK